jgi:hypothetical protein
MRHQPPHWIGRVGATEIRRGTREGCLAGIFRAAGQDALLWVEVVPDLVGVAEASEILGWDRRRVSTYVRRGAFPEPVASLASGRVWRREDIEAFGRDRASRRDRRIAR